MMTTPIGRHNIQQPDTNNSNSSNIDINGILGIMLMQNERDK
jgi:hypothetical protein